MVPPPPAGLLVCCFVGLLGVCDVTYQANIKAGCANPFKPLLAYTFDHIQTIQ